jgi:hypothetical protein
MGSSFSRHSISSIKNSYFSYPMAYIDKQFRKVLSDSVSDTSLLPIIADEYKFHQLRRRLMGQPTPRQSQVEAQIKQYKEINEHDLEEQPKQICASKSIVEQVEKKLFKIKSLYIILMKIDSHQ